jgi:hypothetical protein
LYTNNVQTMRFQQRLGQRQIEAPPMLAQPAALNHLLEIAVPTVRAIGDDQTTLAWELGENAGQDTVPKYKQRAATFAVAITTIKKHVNPLQRCDHFASVVNPEFCLNTFITSSPR